MNPNPNPKSSFDEQQWIIHIRRTLDNDHDEDDNETPVHIFTVPKTLMVIHPDSYTPQQVAIGPYHYTRAELFDMERYKLASAKRNQKEFKNLKLQRLVEGLMVVEPKIRACYHKFLSFNGETLAWMMAVDASFLLEVLQVCAVKQGKATSINIGSRLSHLVDLAGNKAAHNAILKDISMLENQIPLFVLRRLLEFQLCSPDKTVEMLFAMMLGFCQELSPFKMVEDLFSIVQVMECAHLLDVLYRYFVPVLEGFLEAIEEDGDRIKEDDEEQELPEMTNEHKDFFHMVWTKVTNLKSLGKFTKNVIFSKPVKVVMKLPWVVLSKLPMLKVIKEPMENFINSIHKNDEDDKDDKSGTGDANCNKPPVLEEITIPSITELANAGVRFQPATGGISTIAFDDKTMTFYLPIITLDVNSKVVLRNLVAYEACKATGPLVLARYTELMNGIIDTQDDAKLLRENGIIVNQLKSDEEVASLWNGMSKSIRMTKVPFLDKVIEDVNKFYSRRWKVKLAKFMKRYVFESWRLLTFLAAVLMVLFTGLQAFCSVYNCSRVVPIEHLS